MPEQAVAEPSPPQTSTPEYVPPQVPAEAKEPLKVKAGEVWKKEFAKLQKAEQAEADVSKPPEKPVEPPPTIETKEAEKHEIKQPEPEAKPETPKSPLDVLTSEEKPKEEPDVLKEFDEKNANWKRAREVMREQSQKIKEFETKFAEVEKTPKAQPEEVLAIAKERDDFKSRYEKQEEALKALNYQYSETFQNMVKDRDSHVQKIQSRVERLGGDTDKFMAALAMPDGRAKNAAIKEALSDVDTEDRTRIHTLLETLDEKNEKLAQEAQNSSSRWDELSAKRQSEVAEEQAKAIKGLETEFTKIAAALPETVVTMREVPGDDAWNAEIKSARETAMRVLTPGGSDQKESMEIALKGSRYDTLEQRLLSVHKELVEARKRLQEYDSGGPDFKGGDKPKTEAKLLPSQKYHKALEQLKSTNTD